ncbi:MAG: hypothetical protein HYU78_11985 [Rhodocyclales bacterium]|nr:hypothetical protein [Rhodocyclales bacterium]
MTCVKRLVGAGLCLLTVAALSGCAFGTRQPTLVYPPSAASSDAVAAPRSPTVATKRTKVVLASFRDERTDKTVVGTVRNGFGMRTADVVPTNNVADWVTEAVGTELRSNGYTVVRGSAADANDPDSILVSGDVLNVFCDMYMSYTGQVSLLTKVNRGNRDLLTKHYAGEGSAGLAMAATGESYAESLALALRDALRKFAAELEARLAEK